MCDKKISILYGTDSNLGFIYKLALNLSGVSDVINSIPLNTSDLINSKDYIDQNIENLVFRTVESDIIIVMSHGNSDCIYWGKFSNVQKELLKVGNDNDNDRYKRLFENRDVILFSCFSSGNISQEVKRLGGKNILVFGDINTELIDYSNEDEIPLPIASRRHAIRHFQAIISHIFTTGMRILLENEKLDLMLEEIKREANRIIFQIHSNITPYGVEQDYEHLNPLSRNELRMLLLDFYRGIKLI